MSLVGPLIHSILPAFCGEQVHATGRNISNAATEAMLRCCGEIADVAMRQKQRQITLNDANLSTHSPEEQNTFG